MDRWLDWYMWSDLALQRGHHAFTTGELAVCRGAPFRHFGSGLFLFFRPFPSPKISKPCRSWSLGPVHNRSDPYTDRRIFRERWSSVWRTIVSQTGLCPGHVSIPQSLARQVDVTTDSRTVTCQSDRWLSSPRAADQICRWHSWSRSMVAIRLTKSAYQRARSVLSRPYKKPLGRHTDSTSWLSLPFR